MWMYKGERSLKSLYSTYKKKSIVTDGKSATSLYKKKKQNLPFPFLLILYTRITTNSFN